MQKAFKILKDLGVKKAGDIVKLEVNKQGVPLDSFWAKRYKESKFDHCIELVKEKKESLKKAKEDK